MATTELKSSVMDQLTYESLGHLLKDPDPAVAEQAMTLLRNLAHSSVGAAQKEDIELLATKMGSGKLVAHIKEAFQFGRTQTVVQAVYVVSNICTGSEKHKSMVMQMGLLPELSRLFDHEDNEVRVGALWCLNNLVWRESGISSTAGRTHRVQTLRELGFAPRLRALLDDPHVDVRDRARATLDCFDESGGEQRMEIDDPVPFLRSV
mmetsp:Transcript_53139/g.130256  ORF Transcript_53139/g.130256 Transcript_53139/m.130256 type:complete len:207 (-) Transcript_53139:27-647(-)